MSISIRTLDALSVVLGVALGAVTQSGCSALSDFGGYEFSDDSPDPDSGRPDAGDAGGRSGEGGESGRAGEGGESGEGGTTGGEGGTTGGSGGEGGMTGGSGGEGGMTGGSGGDGGDGGSSGTGNEPECTEDTVEDDCENDEQCVNEMCVPIRIPSGIVHTAGGGDVSSPQYRVRVQVGAPQPMGRASSPHFILTLGPGAGRPQ